MRVFSVAEDVFKTEPMFILGCSHSAMATYLERRFKVTIDPSEGQAGQMFTFGCAPWRVVWVEDLPRTLPQLALLFHEVFHLVTRICQDKGVPIKAQTAEGFGDEPAAYLYEFFALRVMSKLRVRVR